MFFFFNFLSHDPSRPLSAGGGSVGCQTLYHLTKLGVTNAVLLERDRLTSGTTWHTAGLTWRLRPSDVEVELIARSRDLFAGALEEETGISTGWINNGGLFIANNRERLDEYHRLHTLGKAYGVESAVLTPAESKELYPLLNVDDIYGTLYSPGDGTVTPEVCTALVRAATKAGAKVERRRLFLYPPTKIITERSELLLLLLLLFLFLFLRDEVCHFWTPQAAVELIK